MYVGSSLISSVDEKLRLKVTDNGLSRDLFPDDYHCLGDNENRPVKWMAPESLLQNQYTTASDVVSFYYIMMNANQIFFIRCSVMTSKRDNSCTAIVRQPSI